MMKRSAVTFTNRMEPELSTASSGISFTVTFTVAITEWNGILSDSSVT